MQHKIKSTIFFLTFAVRRPFNRKDFKQKNMGVQGYFLKKRKLYMQNFTKEPKQPPLVILQKSIFYNIFIRYLWLRIIRRPDYGLVYEFSFTDSFQRYWSWLQSSYIEEKFFVAASVLYVCCYLSLL